MRQCTPGEAKTLVLEAFAPLSVLERYLTIHTYCLGAEEVLGLAMRDARKKTCLDTLDSAYRSSKPGFGVDPGVYKGKLKKRIDFLSRKVKETLVQPSRCFACTEGGGGCCKQARIRFYRAFLKLNHNLWPPTSRRESTVMFGVPFNQGILGVDIPSFGFRVFGGLPKPPKVGKITVKEWPKTSKRPLFYILLGPREDVFIGVRLCRSWDSMGAKAPTRACIYSAD